MASLLAVDLGLRTGLAGFDSEGRVLWYRSQNFGSRRRLINGAAALIRTLPDLSHVVIEGGGELAPPWQNAATRAGLEHFLVDAHTWRESLLLPRQRRTGALAKEAADGLARRVIEWSGAAKPTSLRHDAAEAVLVGLWAVLKLGWLESVPPEVSGRR
ncbi:MAG: hypothetical protein ACI80V_000291 [Rhodothermales bacterium]|jgi:hypothetical protein